VERWFNQIEKKEIWYMVLPLLLVIPLLSFSNQIYGVFQGNMYQDIKLVIQVLIIVFTMAIAIQSYLVFSHLLSNQTLYIGNMFFIIALLELISLFFSQSREWNFMNEPLHILMRLYLAIGFILIILNPKKRLTMNHRILTYGCSMLFVLGSVFLAYNSPKILPENWLDTIDNMVHLIAIILQILTIAIVSTYVKKLPKRSMWLISAAISLIVSDIFFIVSQDQNAIWDFSALIYQFLAFYFFLKAIYYTSVEKPFQQLLKIKKDLEQSQQELRFQAYHDDITLLPNEHLLLKTLKENLHEHKAQKAIIAIEIDRLAAIRSSIGISNSNTMMKLVAERIQSIVPPHYFATKLREGQFVIYIDHVKTIEELLQFCLNLKSAMTDPLQVQLFSLNGSLNIGIALYEEQWTGEELLMHAQLAMREARQIPQRFLFYKPYMSKGIADRILLEQDLHNALANNEFYLDYQPQVNLKLGKWILETACTQAKAWEKQGLPPMKVAVNLSLGQLFQQDLVEMVQDILQRTNLDPSFLQLEITESMTMNIDQMTQLLHELKALGIQIAVDDFGTGYSSLSYLKEFPIDCLKIDRTFVRNVPHNPNDEALVSMIISMAKHLRLKVVAEGIEEVEQLSFLIDGGCDYIQGYLFSKPISPQQMTETYKDLHHRVEEVLTQLQYIEDYII